MNWSFAAMKQLIETNRSNARDKHYNYAHMYVKIRMDSTKTESEILEDYDRWRAGIKPPSIRHWIGLKLFRFAKKMVKNESTRFL